MRSSKRKGQGFSTEFLLAYLIFSLVLVFAFYLWNTTTHDIIESRNRYDIEDRAVDLAEKLLRTRGVPENWSAESVESIGLADDSRILNPDKVLNFVVLMNSSNSNYENNKWLLGIGKYEFYFNLTDANGTTMLINDTLCSAGKKAVNETFMVTVRRMGLLDGEVAIILLTLWYGEPSVTAVLPTTTSTVTASTSTSITSSTTTSTTTTTTTSSTSTSTTTTTTTTSMTTSTTSTTSSTSTTTSTTSTTSSSTTTSSTSTTTSSTTSLITTTIPCDECSSCTECTENGCESCELRVLWFWFYIDCHEPGECASECSGSLPYHEYVCQQTPETCMT